MYFRRNSTRVLFNENIYFNSFENYSENSISKKYFEEKTSIFCKINLRNISNYLRTTFYPVYFLIKQPLRELNYQLSIVDWKKKSRMKCVGEQKDEYLDSIKNFFFFVQKKKLIIG